MGIRLGPLGVDDSTENGSRREDDGEGDHQIASQQPPTA